MKLEPDRDFAARKPKGLFHNMRMRLTNRRQNRKPGFYAFLHEISTDPLAYISPPSEYANIIEIIAEIREGRKPVNALLVTKDRRTTIKRLWKAASACRVHLRQVGPNHFTVGDSKIVVKDICEQARKPL